MDELKKSTPGAADIDSEAHTGIPKAGNVTPGTAPKAADLTADELDDVVGGVGGGGTLQLGSGKNASKIGGGGTSTNETIVGKA